MAVGEENYNSRSRPVNQIACRGRRQKSLESHLYIIFLGSLSLKTDQSVSPPTSAYSDIMLWWYKTAYPSSCIGSDAGGASSQPSLSARCHTGATTDPIWLPFVRLPTGVRTLFVGMSKEEMALQYKGISQTVHTLGSLVMLYQENAGKLQPRWRSPFIISNYSSDRHLSYRLKQLNGRRIREKFQSDHLKPYVPRTGYLSDLTDPLLPQQQTLRAPRRRARLHLRPPKPPPPPPATT